VAKNAIIVKPSPDLSSASGILSWLYGNLANVLSTGRICSNRILLSDPVLPPEARLARSTFQKPSTSTTHGPLAELNNEMLLAAAELLRNETVAGILHSIILPEKNAYDYLLPVSTRESKCSTMCYSQMSSCFYSAAARDPK
jgi:hypothetical protein